MDKGHPIPFMIAIVVLAVLLLVIYILEKQKRLPKRLSMKIRSAFWIACAVVAALSLIDFPWTALNIITIAFIIFCIVRVYTILHSRRMRLKPVAGMKKMEKDKVIW